MSEAGEIPVASQENQVNFIRRGTAIVERNLSGAPLTLKTRDWVQRGIGEYFRECAPQEARSTLTHEWQGKGQAALYQPLSPEIALEVRKMLGAAQGSAIALRNGEPEQFNEKIAASLVTRFEERAREARKVGNDGEAEACLQAAEEYRDLQGVLRKELAKGR